MTKRPKFHPVNNHYVERRPFAKIPISEKLPEVFPPHKLPLAASRSSPAMPIQHVTYEGMIDGFATTPKYFRFFLDTCFITSHEIPQKFWENLVDKEVCITKGVWDELQPWLENPFCNRWFRDYLADAWAREQAGTGHPRVHFTKTEDLPTGMHDVARYYMRLLWMRKYWIVEQVDAFIEKNGRRPEPDELQKLGQTYSGARGWKLAQKAEQNRVQLAKYPADEELVVTAALHSILFARPSYVLTRDNDVIEQWWKGLYLIDTHYHAMRMAERLHDNPSEFNRQPLKSNEHTLFVEDGNEMIEPLQDLAGFRNPERDAVQCSCGIYSTAMSPLTYSERTFGVGADMRRILKMKAKTRGRNTDLFGEKNFHIELDPRKIMYGASGPALVNDRPITVEGSDEFPISCNDSELAIFTEEGFDQEIYTRESAEPSAT